MFHAVRKEHQILLRATAGGLRAPTHYTHTRETTHYLHTRTGTLQTLHAHTKERSHTSPFAFTQNTKQTYERVETHTLTSHTHTHTLNTHVNRTTRHSDTHLSLNARSFLIHGIIACTQTSLFSHLPALLHSPSQPVPPQYPVSLHTRLPLSPSLFPKSSKRSPALLSLSRTMFARSRYSSNVRRSLA